MLDDLKSIHQLDAQDALGVAEKQWQQLETHFPIEHGNNTEFHKITNVVFSGMGGSALAALISQSWPGYDLPFEIFRDYTPGSLMGSGTLFIASSYSGNTEETLEALEIALLEHSVEVAVITSGGKLAEIARAKHLPLIILPSGYQPRHTALYGLKALTTLLDHFKVTEGKQEELKSAAGFLRDQTKSWTPEVPTAKNPAKQLAQELMGKSPVIYAGPKLWPAAYKWKISFNENAKNVAWCNQFSEFNHNEFIGWSSHPIDKPYGIIELISPLEHPQILKRFEVSNRLLSGRWPEVHTIQAQGADLLEQLLWTIAMGDFVSLYLALLNGLNPTPVDLIEKLKTELSK